MWGMRRLGFVVALLLVLAASPAQAADSSFTARGSVEQVYVTGAGEGTALALVNAAGRTLKTRTAGPLGGVLFRNVKPGDGYRVTGGGQESGPLTVLTTADAPPSTDVYDQSIPASGYGYMTTRDGTKLSLYVHPPQDVANAVPAGIKLPALPGGPTPTLIEYSGYGYANPAGPQSGIAILANLMGFTVVDVNMRGTGCSGGAFDFFEPLQGLDGYDVIETVARQPWVLHHKVGMMGISYGGISQLFTAQYNPPSLAAIAPFSVIDQTQTTLYPGGVLNTGFAVAWGKERIHDAKPAGEKTGQAWAYKRIQEGDAVCKANQALHAEAADLLKKIHSNDHYRPKVADPLAPVTFVHKIKAPVYMACQFTDEQTGGHCPTLASQFTGTDRKWFTFTNGTHVDSLDPETFNRWYDFMQLYVAQRPPSANSAVLQAAAPVIYQEAMGISGVTLPPDPIQQEPTYEGALAAFQALPSVRVLFDNGAGKKPGEPYPGFEHSFPSFPVPGTAPLTLPFGKTGKDTFTWNPKARTPTDFVGDTAAGDGGLWTATPPYRWQSPPAGSAASYVSAPLAEDKVVLGAGYVRAWIKASARTVDLQATVTEVRPDGKETFVQGGWLRANERKLDAAKSTPLAPVLSLRKRDVAPLPRGRFAKVTIPLYYQGHAYRKGSRIRVILSAPDGDQPIWAFRARPKGAPTVTVRRRGSRLVLPVVPGVDVPTPLPPCPGLRGEPCREYAAAGGR